jgi:V/A-type H+/Na+-transporting ATPase subunit C
VNDFDYLNARVRGMSTLLLTREFYDQVLSAADTGASLLLDALLASSYGEELQKAMAERRGAPAALAIETAARRSVRAAFSKILAIAPPEPRRLLALQLNRWDAANVVTLLRGKLAGATPHDVVSAVLAIGELDEVQLEELAAEPDITAMADALVTWKHGFAAALRRAIRECRPADDRKALEAAVHRAWFALAFSQLTAQDPRHAPLREILRRQVDLANVLAILDLVRGRERGAAREAPPPIPCGTFPHALLEDLSACASLESAFEILETTYFAPAIEKGILAYGQTRSLAVMERFLEVVVVRQGCRMFRQDVLSLALPLGYIWRKYSELVNLRMLARGAVYRMPANAVREGMVIV